MSEQGDVVRSIRVPADVLGRLEHEAEALDRSVNWLINKAISDSLSGPSPTGFDGGFTFPESELGGLSEWQATLRWFMPSFDFTENIVEKMLSEIMVLIERYGAQKVIRAYPRKLGPMTLRSMERNVAG